MIAVFKYLKYCYKEERKLLSLATRTEHKTVVLNYSTADLDQTTGKNFLPVTTVGHGSCQIKL